jgi:hypothetical protein
MKLLRFPGAAEPGKPKKRADFGDGSWAGGTLMEAAEACQRRSKSDGASPLRDCGAIATLDNADSGKAKGDDMARISRAVLAGAALLCLAGAAQASTTTQVKVFAKTLWTNSGIVLHAGDPVTISASGTWNWSSGGPDPAFGPEGDPIDDFNAFDLFEPFDFFSQGRLVGYIGNLPEQNHAGDPGFFPQTSGYISVGDGQTFIAPYDGKFWLGFNDGAVTGTSGSSTDNTGFVTAFVTVGSATPIGPTITINAPASVYVQGSSVLADYACSDPVTVGCSGTSTNGGAVDTSVLGPHAFVVVANDSNGNTASQSSGYVVVDTATAGVMPVGMTFEPTFLGGKSVIKNFQLVNPQSTPMSITAINTDGDFHVGGTTCGATLAARHACNIHVFFQPEVAGTGGGDLTVSASLAVPSTPLWGIGTQVKATSSALSFPDQQVGTTSAPMTFEVQNFQRTEILLQQIVASGDFAVDPSSTCPVAGGKLRKIRQCSVAVTFSPTASGARAGTLIVHGSVSVDPVSITLSGNGTP